MALAVPVDQLASQGSSFTIEELDVTFPGGQLRKLVLVGAGLPFKGSAKWAGAQRLITTWFVGNGIEGSQQLLGPTEMPSSFSGRWARTLLGRAPCIYFDEKGVRTRIVDPKALWDILDDFRIAGPRLRVTWAVKGTEVVGAVGRSGTPNTRDVDVTVVREGRLQMVDCAPDTHADISWTLNFEWVSRGGRLNRVAEVRKDDDVTLIASSLTDSIDDLDEAIQTNALASLNARVPKSASVLTLGRLETLANGPQALVTAAMNKLRYNVSQLKRAGDLARKISATPKALENSVLDFAKNTKSVAKSFDDSHGQLPFELKSNKTKVSDQLRAHKYFGQISDAMIISARNAAEIESRLRKLTVAGANRGAASVSESTTTRAGDILAIWVCKTGDTPGRLSTKFYGNQDQAVPILKANKLPLHQATFDKGQIIVIPVLTDGTASSTT